MDPFAAIGFVGNLITFVDFGFKLIYTAKDIHSSASGAIADNDDLSTRTLELRRLAGRLKASKAGSLSDQERSLLDVADQCMDISGDLEKLLDKLKTRNPKSKRAAMKAAVRNWRKEDEKDTLEKKLDRCRQQLNLELLSLTRTESLERLDKLICHGQASSDDMQSLTRNMEALRLGNTTSCLGDEALRQIQSLLSLTDDAVLKVRQARVLDSVRFELMNARFEDIEVAHKKTFDWIFDSRAESVAESDASLDSDMDADNESQSEISNDNDEELGDHSGHDIDTGDDQSCATTSRLSKHDSKVNSIGSSRASSFVNDNTPSDKSQCKTSQYRFAKIGCGTVQFVPENGAGENSDSSFEWFVDKPSPIDDDQVSSSSEDDESIAASDYSSSQTPASTDARVVSDSLWQILAEARSSFITWLEQGNGIFHITGKPGSGKSTLMKYLTQHPQTKSHLKVWSNSKKLVSGEFFFWKPGSALQKNTKGLIRGLLHRLLSECPELIPLAFPAQWESAMHREVVHIEHHECELAFEKLIADSQDDSEHKFMFFIDGLDEFEGDHAHLIRQLFKWSNKTQNVKLCISSREWAIFEHKFRDCPKFRLHELTRSDIRQFVSDRLREIDIDASMNCHGHSYNDVNNITRLKEAIVEESDGVFLWVSLVLRHVEEGLHNGDQMGDLMRLIKSLPTELEPMLQQLSDSIPTNNRKLAYSMLSLARFCSLYNHQVSLMQHSFLEEYAENRNFAIDSVIELFTTRETEMRLDRAKTRVYGVCKGFLELRKARVPSRFSNVLGNMVHFTHRSIVEFLEGPYLKRKMDLEHSAFNPFDAYCQTYMGLLKRVRLPERYFSPGYSMDILRIHFPIRPQVNPSVLQDVDFSIVRYIDLGPQEDALRFYKFLDSTSHTLADLELRYSLRKCSAELFPNQKLHYNAANTIALVSGLRHFHEFFEYLLSRQGAISSELIAYCTSASIFSLCYVEREQVDEWRRTCKTLEVLLDNGASPNVEFIPNSGLAFHNLIKCWCVGLSPTIAEIAFLLYQGVNPIFAIVASTTKYEAMTDGFRSEKALVFKVYFISERPKSEPEHQPNTVRIKTDGELFYLEATPETVDILSKHSHVISLRTLVSFWFPDYSDVLQQVIDWILELGVDVDAHHRLQLQSKFDPILRPLFDQDHPDFVGWISADYNRWLGNALGRVSYWATRGGKMNHQRTHPRIMWT
ncbi:hypothetical protein F4818DRAFT_32521 [Hypoxylon cercidicola]|nr:hypothetical protein F4818DRAFT_32521 [Hypoxylon cercidicola]